MKRIIFATAMLLPLLSNAQYDDLLHPRADYTSLYVFLIAFYVLACIIVAVIGDARGWDGGAVFFTGLFATPLIAAVLYSHYKVIRTGIAIPASEPENSNNLT